MKASQTPLLSNRFFCVCGVLEMLGLCGNECAVIHLCPAADCFSMWVRANVSHSGKCTLCVLLHLRRKEMSPPWDFTVLSKLWKIDSFVFSHGCMFARHESTHVSSAVMWCQQWKISCLCPRGHREPVPLDSSLICCGAACLQEEVQRSV